MKINKTSNLLLDAIKHFPPPRRNCSVRSEKLCAQTFVERFFGWISRIFQHFDPQFLNEDFHFIGRSFSRPQCLMILFSFVVDIIVCTIKANQKFQVHCSVKCKLQNWVSVHKKKWKENQWKIFKVLSNHHQQKLTRKVNYKSVLRRKEKKKPFKYRWKRKSDNKSQD